jgi:NADPH:quinone reductase-like Zn-dependent oxidoreductase
MMQVLAVDSLGSLDKLRMMEVPRPEPGAGEVRVAVVAAAVNPADVKGITIGMRILHARKFPMIMGYDFSGRVDAVGTGVQGWKAGDEVFGFVPYSPFTRWGTFAEHTIVKATTLARKPASVPHETAAAVSTVGLTAWQLLRKSPGCGPGTRVLVTGASGGVGSVAIGIVRALGGEVDAVCSSAHRDYVLGLGAGQVFDRGQADWRSVLKGPYQHVLDAAGSFAFSDFRKVLAPKGAFSTTLPTSSFFRGLPGAWLSGHPCRVAGVRPVAADLEQLGRWLESGGVKVPIAGQFPLAEGAKALAQQAQGGVRGKLVLRVA